MTFSSAAYWEERYASGGFSGAGSRGEQADFKATFLNRFVRDRDVATVLEIGCGDGYQLGLAEYPSYVGVDVSPTAVDLCSAMFADDPNKAFTGDVIGLKQAELTLSLDVLYHLIEDDVYARYLADLFALSSRFVILYTSDLDCAGTTNEGMASHMRHRPVTADIATWFPAWRLEIVTKGRDGCWFIVYASRS